MNSWSIHLLNKNKFEFRLNIVLLRTRFNFPRKIIPCHSNSLYQCIVYEDNSKDREGIILRDMFVGNPMSLSRCFRCAVIDERAIPGSPSIHLSMFDSHRGLINKDDIGVAALISRLTSPISPERPRDNNGGDATSPLRQDDRGGRRDETTNAPQQDAVHFPGEIFPLLMFCGSPPSRRRSRSE